MKAFTVIARRWFDKRHGNTYHTVRCIRHTDGKVVNSIGLTYGYGDSYRQTALKLMFDNGWFKHYRQTTEPKKGYTYASLYCLEREHNYPIIWTVADTSKKEALKLSCSHLHIDFDIKD